MLMSELMSADSTASNSSPSFWIRRPVFTSYSTTTPECPPRPPPASNTAPLRLNRKTYGTPSGNGMMPKRAPLSELYRAICFCPAIASTGAHGLEAIAVTAAARFVASTGWRIRFSGYATGPVGLPEPLAVISNVFFFLITTLEPAFSNAPPSIHFLIKSSFTAASLSCIGGIRGSSM